jgi:NAD(P)-dependent dehydrogenase (short-subunit alcohol dehydrogenase family)
VAPSAGKRAAAEKGRAGKGSAGNSGAPRGLEGSTALVTGGTSGIGRAVAEALAREGVRVAVAARTRKDVATVAKALGGFGIVCDVASPKSVRAMASRFQAWAGGPPDILVTAAGVFSLNATENTSDEELARNLDVNLKGTVLTVRAFLAGMKARGSGTIVHVSSAAGRKAFAENGAYSASKFGVRGFHEVLLEELRGTGVRATLLEPAAVDTPIWDGIDRSAHPGLPRRGAMLRPSAVAECVVFVAGRDPRIQIPVLPVEAI